METNIKYFIEKKIKFNTTDYSDDEDDLIDRNTIANILNPKERDELWEIIKKRIYENKFGNNMLYFPDLSDIDTYLITDMSCLFLFFTYEFNDNIPIKLDLSTWDTSNVTNMSSLFANMKNLINVDLSGWNTSNVTNMSYMFSDCKKIEELDLSNFDTNNVMDMTCMF